MLFGARRLGADVEHVDDAAPAPLLHLRRDQADQADRGEQLVLEILLHDLVGQLLERAVARGAGVVDDDVDLAERLHHLVVGALDVGRGADVGLHADHLLPFALRLDGVDRLVERLAGARQDGDVGAGCGEPRRDREADALAAAGDDGANGP